VGEAVSFEAEVWVVIADQSSRSRRM
jgi:hypothetical protein